MPKPFLVEHALELAIGVIVLGAVLSIVSLMEFTFQNTPLGNWADWTIVVGLIAFLVGLYLLASFLRLAASFDQHMKTESRAEFKRDLDEVEYLAWRLPSRYERRLSKKKEDLGIK